MSSKISEWQTLSTYLLNSITSILQLKIGMDMKKTICRIRGKANAQMLTQFIRMEVIKWRIQECTSGDQISFS